VATNIAQVIGTAATERKGAGVFIFLDVNFVEGGVVIVFHPKGNRAHQFIMFQEFHVTDGVDLLPPADDLIGSVIVHKFQQV
jgi:hypothetical protein